MSKQSRAVPENINEEYYQISPEILASFSKYRPPVDLYRFREDILSLAPYSRKGQRLTNEQVEEVQQLCAQDALFVSRSDHPIYSEHIVKQLDLVLQDANLKEAEIADICTRAIVMRFNEFAAQPVKPVFEVLYKDLMVLTEWLWQDKHRVKAFMRRLIIDTSLAAHAFNTMAVGLWLWMSVSPDDYRRRDLDRTALALLLHNIGMTKVPQFILAKEGPLKPEEREKVLLHPLLGYKMLQRIDIVFDELTRAILEHHELMDGTGYPQRSKGEQISLIGRITAVAEAFASLLAKRKVVTTKDLTEMAGELAANKNNYDPRLTGLLLSALMTDSFGDLRHVDLNLPEQS